MKYVLFILIPALSVFAHGNLSTHNPNTTATIVIHGFDPDGASQVGTFGEDVLDEVLLHEVGAYAGLPVSDGSATLPTNVIATTTYYGDTAPSYYTLQDIAELAAVTKQYGGGIPRYALIIAKYARHIMDRSGATQVNVVSASLGSFVGRWMIEKDSDSLVSDGKVARWLSLEGVLCGNWAASNDLVQDLWDDFGTPTIDTDHMKYAWVEANLHSPRREADNPLFSEILIGMEMSTRDTAGAGTMTDIMLLEGDFHANDGVVTVDDGYFESMSPQSKFFSLSTTHSWMHVNHYELQAYAPAMMQIANFLTKQKRVIATVTRLQVTNTQEPGEFWWDWMPAEIVIESDVHSPYALLQWGITESICVRGMEGTSSPIYEFNEDGEEQSLSHIVYDEFVSEIETSLDITLGCFEIDWSEKYDIFEPLDGDGNPLGECSFVIPIGSSGTTTQEFSTGNFNGTLQIRVIEYPFETLDVAVAGDVNGDGFVNVSDILVVISAWGPCSGCDEDIDNSGTVDVSDLLYIIGNWN